MIITIQELSRARQAIRNAWLLALLIALPACQAPGPAQPVPAQQAPTQETSAQQRQSIEARALEIARLEALIEKDWEQYQRYPRRRFIGSTVPPAFANYVETVLKRVHEVIEKNSFDWDREQPELTGVFTISIKADGQLERADMNRSSGNKVVDDFALRILNEAAPFEPFSAEISKSTDILSITRRFRMRMPIAKQKER
jgi:protein TonB